MRLWRELVEALAQEVEFRGRKHRLEVPEASAIDHDCWDGESPIGKGQKRCYWHLEKWKLK